MRDSDKMGPIEGIHLFTNYGATYTFKNVTNVVTNENIVSFNYSAMSDGRDKHGTFFTKNLAGFTRFGYEH